MGVASRTKWERRVNQPLAAIVHLDPAKLAYRARITHGAFVNRERKAILESNIHIRRSEACDALEARRQRRRVAHSKRGWLPRAER